MLTDIIRRKLAFLNKIYDRTGSLNITDARTDCILLSSSRAPKELCPCFLHAIHTTALRFSIGALSFLSTSQAPARTAANSTCLNSCICSLLQRTQSTRGWVHSSSLSWVANSCGTYSKKSMLPLLV